MPMEQPPFRLSPQEDWIFGVKMRGQVLSFGPSGSALAMSTAICVMTSGMGALMAFASSAGTTVNGYEVKNHAAMAVTGGLVTLYGAIALVASLLVGVRADASGVHVRRLWRRRVLPWESIVSLRCRRPSRTVGAPTSGPIRSGCRCDRWRRGRWVWSNLRTERR